MKPAHAEELLAALKERPLSLEELHERARAAGSAWTLDQLELFLDCVAGVERDGAAGAFRMAGEDPESDLQHSIVEVVRSFAGRPVPAAQVRERLPDRFVTTDEQIRAIAKRTDGLEIIGPGLIRTAP